MSRLLLDFEEKLCGVFDNRRQCIEEESRGDRYHPAAWHGIKSCNDRIGGLPSDFQGLFVIEESRFDLGDRKVEKHYLFLYEAVSENSIRLTSYDLPVHMLRESLSIANTDLKIEYTSLSISPRFSPLVLVEKDGEYTGANVSPFGTGLLFHFSLRVTADALYVEERLERDGEIVAGYRSPIEYRRQD